uniref:Leucine rich repeat (In FLII) interacting protein 1-like protein n=1 Tax=Callorhinchus milii TaxID=7868 RepID=V9KBK7_CALMI
MGTHIPVRKRIPNRERLSAEDDALNQIAREAEARLAAKRAARAEAREIRMKELERQQKEVSDEDERMSVGSRGSLRVEERPEKDFGEKGSRTTSSLSAATLASLGGTSSRRGSGDTIASVDTEASIREIKDSLAEVEEKYRKAMVSNAQLDNEKNTLMYQVDTLQDVLLEVEEHLAESNREFQEKAKELEREKHAHSVLQFQFEEIKESLKQREEMLMAHGLVVSEVLNGDGGREGDSHTDPAEVASRDAAPQLPNCPDGPLDFRLRKLLDERDVLLEQVKKLKAQIDDKMKNGKVDNVMSDDAILQNGTDLQMIEVQRDANRQVSEYKFKLAKSEQEIIALEQNIIRLESQVLRYKGSAENAEKVEDDLKAEKRKLQREVRSALDKIEELEMSNSHLVKRLEKKKANRSALLSQQ